MSHDGVPGIGHFGHLPGSGMNGQAYEAEGPPLNSQTLTTSSGGRFKCPHPACDKSFTRQEHLSRHKLNHWPKEIFKCSYVFPNTGLACNRTFVRKDLLARHVKRHTKTGGRLQSNSSALGDYGAGSQSAASLASPPTTGAAGSVPPTLLPPQSVGLTEFNPEYQSPMNENASAPADVQQNAYDNFNHQQRHYSTNNNNNEPHAKNSAGTQNSNQFFNWLFEGGNGSSGQPSSGYGTASTERNSINASPLPTAGLGMAKEQLPHAEVPKQQLPEAGLAKQQLPPAGLAKQELHPAEISNNSSAAHNLSSGSYPMYGFNQGGTVRSQPQVAQVPEAHHLHHVSQVPQIPQAPQVPQAPQAPQVPQLSQLSQASQVYQPNQVPQVCPPGAEPIATPGSVNKMQDLFSIDFLSNDPLQTFMQELTEAKASSQDTNFLEKDTDSPSVSPIHSDPMIRRDSKLQNARRCSMKDNLLVQKSNIDELQRQTKQKKKLPSQKQKALYSMKSVPSFFHSDPRTKFDISQEKCEELYDFVPELREVPERDLKKSLRSFWSNFHTQYGLLHKPSFHIDEQPPILILALIMVGASSLGSNHREMISDVICAPLRWIIFSHDDFQPPSKTYIIQSLLFVEGYEKTSTNRYLHERSYVHHGTTIQLLRRTPSLGGHPLILKTEEQPNGWQDPEQVYRQWIDFEMLKRVAFYAFYMDTTHAVVFGYLNLFINCNQIQLTLPCSDLVWESYDLSYDRLLEYGFEKEHKTFLATLKRLMGEVVQMLQKDKQSLKEEPPKPKSWDLKSVLGKKILLAGIISTMFQCQESNNGDLFSTTIKCTLCMEDQNKSWQEIFSFALDYWLYRIQGSCTIAKDCFVDSSITSVGAESKTNSKFPQAEHKDDMEAEIDTLSRINDTGCKIPEYHMAQVILRIFQYDYYIYSGAPWRMNVRSGNEEYDLVSDRILQFASDTKTGGVAMIYAYQFLFQQFIDRETGSIANKTYNVNSDYCITRPNTVALLALLVWSYNFRLNGPETLGWDNTESDASSKDPQLPETKTFDNGVALSNQKFKENYTPKESFEAYLVRMYQILNVDSSSTDPVSYHNDVLSKAELLQTVSGTNNLCGMMKFMKKLYENSYWDLGREFAKLFDNCLERCMGKSNPTCESMYKV